jgi:four helix bundle protein
VWAENVPNTIRLDPLWRVTVYRLSLYAADIGWDDVTLLVKDPRTRSLADQLYRALGGISSTIAEGYSRGGGRDRARFYEYALGSARESRDWYYKGRHALDADAVSHRLGLLSEIIRLLLKMVPDQRSSMVLREDQEAYDIEP